jgi:hypothetical protein
MGQHLVRIAPPPAGNIEQMFFSVNSAPGCLGAAPCLPLAAIDLDLLPTKVEP